ncbi:MAG: hypothetical protein ACTSQI_11975 [Candidatus Helarchaeota archaeon]
MEDNVEIRYEVQWEGRYSQCSFNNLASVLDHFYGIPGMYPPEEMFKRSLPYEMRGLFGWAPYTGFMVKSGRLVWNEQKVENLDCEWFELKAKRIGERTGMIFSIQLDNDELLLLKREILHALKKGPLILWVPYGAGRFRFSPTANWKNVQLTKKSVYSAVVAWITHCIVVGGYINGQFQIFDSSDRNGVFLISPNQLIINSLAMNLNPAVEKAAFLEGLAMHCCIFRKQSP